MDALSTGLIQPMVAQGAMLGCWAAQDDRCNQPSPHARQLDLVVVGGEGEDGEGGEDEAGEGEDGEDGEDEGGEVRVVRATERRTERTARGGGWRGRRGRGWRGRRERGGEDEEDEDGEGEEQKEGDEEAEKERGEEDEDEGRRGGPGLCYGSRAQPLLEPRAIRWDGRNARCLPAWFLRGGSLYLSRGVQPQCGGLWQTESSSRAA